MYICFLTSFLYKLIFFFFQKTSISYFLEILKHQPQIFKKKEMKYYLLFLCTGIIPSQIIAPTHTHTHRHTHTHTHTHRGWWIFHKRRLVINYINVSYYSSTVINTFSGISVFSSCEKTLNHWTLKELN